MINDSWLWLTQGQFLKVELVALNVWYTNYVIGKKIKDGPSVLCSWPCECETPKNWSIWKISMVLYMAPSGECFMIYHILHHAHRKRWVWYNRRGHGNQLNCHCLFQTLYCHGGDLNPTNHLQIKGLGDTTKPLCWEINANIIHNPNPINFISFAILSLLFPMHMSQPLLAPPSPSCQFSILPKVTSR